MFGIVRPLDRLGRIVLPMEFRKTMGLKEGTQMEIIGTRDGLLLRPYRPEGGLLGQARELQESAKLAQAGPEVDRKLEELAALLADHYRKTLWDMVQNDNHIMWNPPSSVMEGVTVAIPRRRND